jgi:hypothetical protein
MSSLVFAGVEYTSKITTTGNKKSMNSEMTSVVYAQNGDVKQVYKNVPKKQRGLMTEDGYWLFKGKDNTLYIVDDKEKTVTPMSIDSMLQMTQMAGKLVKITIEDHKVKTETLGKAKMLGVLCDHVRITSSYTMKMKITFIKKTFKVKEVKEIWATNNLSTANEVNRAFFEKDFKTGWEDLDKMIAREMKQMKKLGFPLKTVTRHIQMNKKGKVQSDQTTTMEILDMKSKKFSSSFFEVPKDYEVAQMGPGEEEEEDTPKKKKKKKKFGLF